MFRSLPRRGEQSPAFLQHRPSLHALTLSSYDRKYLVAFSGHFFLSHRSNVYHGCDTSARDSHHYLRTMHLATWLMQYALLRRSLDLFLLRQESMYGTSTGQSGMERCQHTVRL
jgi:hypothetical protein